MKNSEADLYQWNDGEHVVVAVDSTNTQRSEGVSEQTMSLATVGMSDSMSLALILLTIVSGSLVAFARSARKRLIYRIRSSYQ